MKYEELNVQWVPYETVEPNDYNPNIMSVRDKALLAASVLEDGWTQPIVALRGKDGAKNVIVDGEQRWTVAGEPLHSDRIRAIIEDLMIEQEIEETEVNQGLIDRLRLAYLWVASREEEGILTTRLVDLSRGEVPVHFVDFMDEAHSIISTLRHNRARGVHAQALMIGIVSSLREKHKMSYQAFERRLGMNSSEVDRLVASLPIPQRLNFPGGERYSAAWDIQRVIEMKEDQRQELGVNVTPGVQLLSAASQAEQAEREAFINAEIAKELKKLGYDEDNKAPPNIVIPLRQKFLATLPDTTFPMLRRMIFALTPEQKELLTPSLERILTEELTHENMPAAVVMACQYVYDMDDMLRAKIKRRHDERELARKNRQPMPKFEDGE